MLSEREIRAIAQTIIRAEKINAQVKFLPYQGFVEKAKKSPLVKMALEKGSDFYDLNVPSIFSHKTNTIYFNKKMLSKLLHDETISVQKKFIKAITYHELFHYLNKKRMKKKTFKAAIFSENKAEHDFKKRFPELAALGKRIASKHEND